MGLLGDVRSRAVPRGGAVFVREDLKASLALGGYGTARGDGVCGVVDELGCEHARFCGDNGEGDRGDLGEELGDLVTKRNLEGDRDSDRRMDLTAEVTSTWRTCVGDGSVSVPPPPFENDMILGWNVAMLSMGERWMGNAYRQLSEGESASRSCCRWGRDVGWGIEC